MLSRQEKKELLKDAADFRRQKDFRKLRPRAHRTPSLDAYLRFLSQIHKVFSSVTPKAVKTVVHNFKL